MIQTVWSVRGDPKCRDVKAESKPFIDWFQILQEAKHKVQQGNTENYKHLKYKARNYTGASRSSHSHQRQGEAVTIYTLKGNHRDS